MDAANKQNAVIAEVTQGTTPSTPAFKLLRDSSITGAPSRSSTRSPERRSDRAAANMVTGLSSFAKTINMAFARDAATDILLESVFCAAWSTNVLKNGSTAKPFTLEEKYEGGATDPYRRLVGCMVTSLGLSFRLGEAGQMTFGIMAYDESNATSAIASSTYAAPTPGYDPVSSNDITVSSLGGLSSPKVTALNLQINNNISNLHKFGDDNPFGLGLGLFDVSGDIEFYFAQAADYTGFIPRLTSSTLDIVIGSVTNFKDQITMSEVDFYNPDITDPGATGQHMVRAQFMGRYDSGDTSVIKWTRLVA